MRADEATRPPRTFPRQVGLLEVVDAFPLTPAMRRVVFTAPEIAALRVDEPGEIVTLIWPAPGAPVVLPERGRRRFPDDAPEQHVRNCTVRDIDRPSRRLTVDFFLHDDPGRAGGWAAAAAPGQVIGFGGTRAHWTTDPAARWSLLVADESGLPALAAIAESRPSGHRTIAVAEVRDEREDPALPRGRGIEEHCLLRGTRPADSGSGILTALADLDLPEGPGQVWVATETHLVAQVRTHLVHERGVPRDALSAIGHWRRDHD